MADDETEEPKKKSKLPMILGVVLAVGGGAGGYLFATGAFSGAEETTHDTTVAAEAPAPLADISDNVAFIPVGPIIVTLGRAAQSNHLRFSANLEVPSTAQNDVEKLLPRVTDALHSFLQALDESDVNTRDGLVRLRTLMLHRVRLVLGEDRITDLLVSEFVLN